MQSKLLGITSVDFSIIGQLLTIYFSFIKHLVKMRHPEAVLQLFIELKKVYDSLRMKVPYNILIDFCTPTKLAKCV
jgi:hypothetical protein